MVLQKLQGWFFPVGLVQAAPCGGFAVQKGIAEFGVEAGQQFGTWRSIAHVHERH